MTFIVVLNAIRNGTRNQSFLKKATVVDNPEGITLGKVFCDEIISKHPHASVSGSNITKIETEKGTDLLDLINLPISNTFTIIKSTDDGNTINAHFDVNLAVGESIPEDTLLIPTILHVNTIFFSRCLHPWDHTTDHIRTKFRFIILHFIMSFPLG